MTAAESIVTAADRALQDRSLDEAMMLFNRAESLSTNVDRCAAGRWMIHMLRGSFEEAWKESDAIRARNPDDPHRLWQGEPVAGKRVMLRCLHGFGDAVQFSRYIPRLREIAAHVTVQVAPGFTELAAWFDFVDDVITWGGDDPSQEPAWDVQIEIMELPHLFRTQLGELPIAQQYLQLPAQTNPSPSRSSTYLRVGLVWTAGEWNAMRSIPFSMLKPLFEVRGCEFWNLQPCGAEMEEATLREDEGCQQSITGLAMRIATLDLVITVDTLAAHLTGALNLPAWVMLQHEADWRWMHQREDSPWYPSLRLFRQTVAGEWSDVISSVCEALEELARAHSEQKMVA